MAIHLTPDIEEALDKAARRHGTTPDSIVESLVRKELATVNQPEPRPLASTDLLSVARAVGLSPSALKKFIDGAGRQMLDQVDALVATVTEGDRSRVRRDVLGVIASTYLVRSADPLQANGPQADEGIADEPAPAGSLAEFLEGYAGVFDSRELIPGGARFSENTGEQFTDMLVEKRAQGHL